MRTASITSGIVARACCVTAVARAMPCAAARDVPEKADYTGRRSTALYLYVVPRKAP